MIKFIKLYFKAKKEKLLFEYKMCTIGNSFLDGMADAIGKNDIKESVDKLINVMGLKNE